MELFNRIYFDYELKVDGKLIKDIVKIYWQNIDFFKWIMEIKKDSMSFKE